MLLKVWWLITDLRKLQYGLESYSMNAWALSGLCNQHTVESHIWETHIMSTVFSEIECLSFLWSGFFYTRLYYTVNLDHYHLPSKHSVNTACRNTQNVFFSKLFNFKSYWSTISFTTFTRNVLYVFFNFIFLLYVFFNYMLFINVYICVLFIYI